MNADPALRVDKRRARRAFDHAAAAYDANAVVQRHVADNLVEALDVMQISPARILDLGAGTGYCAEHLERRYRRPQIVLYDVSLGMLGVARQKRRGWLSRRRFVCGDAEALPFADASFDLVVSSLVLPWCNDLDAVFAECRRVLVTGGLILFSSLGPDTLRELRHAWRAADDSPHINQFIDMHDIGDALVRAGFSSPVLDCDPLTATYADVPALMQDLRAGGATNSLHGRRRGLSTASALARMSAAYEGDRRDGRLPATFEVVYAHAWKPDAATRPQDGSTVVSFPIADLRRRQ